MQIVHVNIKKIGDPTKNFYDTNVIQRSKNTLYYLLFCMLMHILYDIYPDELTQLFVASQIHSCLTSSSFCIVSHVV